MAIKQKDLLEKCTRLNDLTNSPTETSAWGEDGFEAQVGNYYPWYADGGVQLVKIVNKEGSITTLTHLGTKRDLFNQLNALILGIEIGKCL